MLKPARQKRLVTDIIKKYGPVIDLEKHPNVLIEILREHSAVFNTDGTGGVSSVGSTVAGGMGSGTGGGGTGGSGGGTGGSGGVNKAEARQAAEINEVMRAVLDLRKEVRNLSKQMKGLGPRDT